MKPAVLLFVVCTSLFAPLFAQDFKLPPGMESLSASARNSVDVTLDGPTLQLLARFLDSDNAHDASVKQVLSKIQGIYVRSLEFDQDHAYIRADLDAFRAQFHSPEWSRIVGVRTRDGENAEVFLKSTPDGKLGGLCVIAAEPRELTIVHVTGTIDPAQLADLDGEFGIPHLSFDRHSARRSVPGDPQ